MTCRDVARVFAIVIFLGVSGNAPAQYDDTESVLGLLEKSGTTLNTFEDKFRFLQDAWYLFKWRQEFTPGGYEDSEEFSNLFIDSFRHITVVLLQEGAIEIYIEEEVASRMAEAFRDNKEAFSEFKQSVESSNRYFNAQPEHYIASVQVRYAAIAYTLDEGLWEEIFDFTGFFPFC